MLKSSAFTEFNIASVHTHTHTHTHTHNSTIADELPSVTYLNQITYPKAHFYSVPIDFPAENHSFKIFCSKKIGGYLGLGVEIRVTAAG